MNKFTWQYMQVLAMQIEKIHSQNIYLRQLYMKLYITLPSLQEWQNIVGDKMEWSDCVKLKVRNIVYLYELSINHVKKMDHLKLQQIDEDIDVVIEFIQAVQNNFKQLC